MTEANRGGTSYAIAPQRGGKIMVGVSPRPEGPDESDQVSELRELLNQRSNERDQAEKLLGVSVGILHRSNHDDRRDPTQCNFLICQQASRILPPGAFS
jgi:hypothetical protein